MVDKASLTRASRRSDNDGVLGLCWGDGRIVVSDPG